MVSPAPPPPLSSKERPPGAFRHLSLRSAIEKVLDLFSARVVAEFILLPASHHHRHLCDTGRLCRVKTEGEWGDSVLRGPYLPALPSSRPLVPPRLPLWSLLGRDCSPPLTRRRSPMRFARMRGLLGFSTGFRGFPSRTRRPRRLGVAIAHQAPGRLCGAVRDPA